MRRRKKKNKTNENQSMIGSFIDADVEVFKRELIAQKVNIGTISNCILSLESAYNELRERKDAVIKLIKYGDVDTSQRYEYQKALQHLYIELQKVEDKIVILKERREELLKLDIDS